MKPLAVSGNVDDPRLEGTQHPSFAEAFRFWLKLGFISFGGPTGQIAIMHAELVEKKKWISEARFLHALNYCMLLPGPEAQQLAIYVGWLLHKTWGGIVAGALFVIPSIFILWGLSYIYVAYGNLPWIAAIFYGLKPAVLAIVAAAVMRIGGRALKNEVMWTLAVAAFVAIFFLHVPFPLIIISAAAIGFLGGKLRRDKFLVIRGHGKAKNDSVLDDTSAVPEHAKPSWSRALRVCITWLLLWWGPVLLLGFWLRLESYAISGRSLFQHRGDCHFWRGVCGAPVCGAAGRPTLWLAHRRSDARWFGTRRNDSGPVDHGHAVCRLSRRLEQSWTASTNSSGHARRIDHYLEHLCTLFSMDLPGWTVHRTAPWKRRAEHGFVCSYRSSRRRGPEPSRLVWASCRFPDSQHRRLVRYRCRGSRFHRHDQMEVGHNSGSSWSGSCRFVI